MGSLARQIRRQHKAPHAPMDCDQECTLPDEEPPVDAQTARGEQLTRRYHDVLAGRYDAEWLEEWEQYTAALETLDENDEEQVKAFEDRFFSEEIT